MNRRDFLRTSTLASTAVMFPAMAPPLARAEAGSGEAWRVFDVTTRVEILKPAGVTRVWIPTPLLDDTPFQKTLGNKFDAEAGTARLERLVPEGTMPAIVAMLSQLSVEVIAQLQEAARTSVFGPAAAAVRPAARGATSRPWPLAHPPSAPHWHYHEASALRLVTGVVVGA